MLLSSWKQTVTVAKVFFPHNLVNVMLERKMHFKPLAGSAGESYDMALIRDNDVQNLWQARQ
jgi:hypothetical protein